MKGKETNMRKPFERTNNGQYVHKLEDIDEYAFKVAEELCGMYPDVDIIDIEYKFSKKLGYKMMRQLSRESAEKL